MPNLLVVRSNYGQYTPQFLSGQYVAIGWLDTIDLSNIESRDELYPIYKQYYPNDTSSIVIGQQVGQIGRFLLEIKEGDYVITQSVNSDRIHYGMVVGGYYYAPNADDGCPFFHRKPVKWLGEASRSVFSVPFQNSIRSSLTVFYTNHSANFFEHIGKAELAPKAEKIIERSYSESILERLMELDATEFEILITHLLAALGFDGPEHTGKPGDGGVDARGELNVSGMAKIKLVVQAKRYQPNSVIKSSDVKALRQSIPRDGQGAFITTAKFDKKAEELAQDPDFPRIGLIDGSKLVDIVTENWNRIPADFQKKLNLRVGLIPM